MTASIHALHPRSPPVAGFLRIGHTGHRKLEHLHAAGRFPYRRVGFDAAHVCDQSELLKTLIAGGCEIVLDPNFAEMAMPGRFGSAAGKLPWANPNRPWQESDFGRIRNLDTAKAIAEFAIRHGVNVVLTPAHLIESCPNSWRNIDLRMCEDLRRELDRLGGAGIAIDYQLITTNALLKDAQARDDLVADVDTMPIQNVWLRTSGFGATETGVGTRHFIEAVRGLHRMDRPLVADCVGGFAGLAALAFGAVGGISHGAGQKESFDANDWKALPSDKKGGSSSRIYVPDLDRHFKEDHLSVILAARGGRSRFGCNDSSCCRDGIEDMVENPGAHFITQRARQLEDLSRVPETRRAEHFLLRHLDPAIRSARVGTRLDISEPRVKDTVEKAKARLIRLRDALADLQVNDASATRSRPPAFRGGPRSAGVVLAH